MNLTLASEKIIFPSLGLSGSRSVEGATWTYCNTIDIVKDDETPGSSQPGNMCDQKIMISMEQCDVTTPIAPVTSTTKTLTVSRTGKESLHFYCMFFEVCIVTGGAVVCR